MKIIIRTLLKNKLSTLLNVTGLALGLTAFIAIMLYVLHERSYDRHVPGHEAVVRVVKDFVNEDQVTPDATTAPGFAYHLKKDFPEVVDAVRLMPNWGFPDLVKVDGKSWLEPALMRADSQFFRVFPFTLLEGDPSTALSDPTSVVISESAAKKYFAYANAIGKTMEIRGREMTVTGIMRDVPRNTHFKADMLLSFQYGEEGFDDNWDSYNFYTYVRLREGEDIAAFNNELPAWYKKHRAESQDRVYAQPLADIHLNSKLKWELSANGDAGYVNILTIIAIFILVIAAVNYVNLATAQSGLRAREVGVRKVIGADKGALMRQFLLEALTITFGALVLAVGAVGLLLPLFNQVSGRELALFESGQGMLWLMVVGATLVVGLLAGLYPAMFLSSFKPVNVLKGNLTSLLSGALLRKGLVTFQFVISIGLMAGTIIVYQQLNYIRNKNLGFDKEQVLLVENLNLVENSKAFIREVRSLPEVSSAGVASGVLAKQNWTKSMRREGAEAESLVNLMLIDYDYLPTLGVEFEKGRNFSPEFPRDTLDRIILNETALAEMGISEPAVGKRLIFSDEDPENPEYKEIIGVVKDFHFTDLRVPIRSFAFILAEEYGTNLAVKLDGQHINPAIKKIGELWAAHFPGTPFGYSFQDEQVARLHEADERFNFLVLGLTVLAIAIACLGLLGLAAFTAQQRTKEIGIRKVLGASVAGIIGLLARDFVRLLILALIIASPLAWYAMSSWLDNFAYRIDIAWWVFLLAGAAALVIALLTIGSLSAKAALASPVRSLRSE